MEQIMSRLILLLSLYFCIYGSAHLYVLIKLRRAYYWHGISYVLLFILLIFLMFAPIQARILEARDHLALAIVSAWIGYTWMGFLFVAICVSLPLDGYHLLMGLGQRLAHQDWARLMLSRRQCVGFATLAALGIMAYGAFEAYHLRIEKIALTTTKLPATVQSIRIVQISDLHLGLMYYPGRIQPLLNAIDALKPDVLVSTGDLVDGRTVSIESLAAELHALKAPLGKFAVTGNHEFYMGLENSQRFIEKAGFQLLRNQSVKAGGHLAITGVDDPAGAAAGVGLSEAELGAANSPKRFSLLLKHRPTLAHTGRTRFDLQLSGHTHKGQIFPFNLLVALSYPIRCGLHRLEGPNPVNLYVSRGAGTWGPPIRLLAPPEITVIDLMPGGKTN
jgi:predicted MPP superfamily phosphohydrolase